MVFTVAAQWFHEDLFSDSDSDKTWKKDKLSKHRIMIKYDMMT